MQTRLLIILFTAAFSPLISAHTIDTTNYYLGTQHIGAHYQFTDKPVLIEGAQAILGMGSNILKIRLGPDYVQELGNKRNPAVNSLETQVRDDPVFRELIDMPFAHYFLWTYCFSTHRKIWPWHGRMNPETLEKEYREIYDLTRHLLTTYNNTGKTFYLGNWEGDWHLMIGATDPTKPKWNRIPNADAVPGIIDWINTRQAAVDDAKRDTPHQNVRVYHYLEVNLVQKSILRDERTVTRDVLPHTPVDFVSYSSYDSTNRAPGRDIRTDLHTALDYIETRLTPKPGIQGKRVLIGEYGYPLIDLRQGAVEQDRLAREVMIAALEWGCPFILWWELYNNEITSDGKQKGYWLIDDKNEKQPLYRTHQNAIRHLKTRVPNPTPETLRTQLIQYLKTPSPKM